MSKGKTLQEQLAEAERRVAKIKEKQRKLETRKKIIAGAALMNAMDESNLRDFLDQHVTRKEDRQVWGLPDNTKTFQDFVEEHNLNPYSEKTDI